MSDPRAHPELVEAYATERIKTLSTWSCFTDGDMEFRPAARARTPREHMVHQCVSEDTWMRNMLSIAIDGAPLPTHETRLEFLRCYARASEVRVERLRSKTDEWWSETTRFFDVERSRAWVFVRRLAHSAHHRGQLTVYLRLLGRPVYSTYGPTADTGGLFANKAPTIYRYPSAERLLAAEETGGDWPDLPGPGPLESGGATERP
jgi:uncharacterized damage-inducible protein DinB